MTRGFQAQGVPGLGLGEGAIFCGLGVTVLSCRAWAEEGSAAGLRKLMRVAVWDVNFFEKGDCGGFRVRGFRV